MSEKRIRVLMVTRRFIYGGIEKLLLDIFENSDRSIFQYDVLALNSEADESLLYKLKSLNVNYQTLSLDKCNKSERRKKHYNGLSALLKKNTYDVVHVNITNYKMVFDLYVAKKAGIKRRIIHAHSANINTPTSLRIYKPARKLYDFVATDWCACSVEAAQYLFSKKIIKNKKYTVINNGIKMNDFLFSEESRKRIRSQYDIFEDTKLIGHVGRFTEAKNHTFLIDVFHEILLKNEDYKLMLVGDGELKDSIVTLIENYNISDKVILTGACSNIGEILSAFDLFVFPSIWEGLGISVIEAQCNGLRTYISDKVPEQATITSNVRKLELNKGPKYWATEIIEDQNIRINESSLIENAGYDILHSVKQLEEIYQR